MEVESDKRAEMAGESFGGCNDCVAGSESSWRYAAQCIRCAVAVSTAARVSSATVVRT